jgi:hypothetical protein
LLGRARVHKEQQQRRRGRQAREREMGGYWLDRRADEQAKGRAGRQAPPTGQHDKDRQTLRQACSSTDGTARRG